MKTVISDMKQTIVEHPILAILRNLPPDLTCDAVGAILAGGVSFFEVALNSPHAPEQIDLLRRHFGDRILVGAGTATSVDRVRLALDAGAQFLLSPSTDPDVLDYCRRERVPILPGALTPSEVSTCLRFDCRVIKLFPAGDMPMRYVKSLQGPFDSADFVAIGGVTPENAADFIRAGCLGVGLGSCILPAGTLKTRGWNAASAYVADLCQKVRQALSSR